MTTANRTVRSNPPFPQGNAGVRVPEVYSLTDLGVLPDMGPLLPVTLNDQGDLAAHGYSPSGEPDSWKVYGYVIRDGRRTQSLIPPGKTPISGLNASGQMCGSARRGFSVLHAWATHLGWFGANYWPDRDSYCTGINASGTVTGHVVTPTEKGGTIKRAFVVSPTGEIHMVIPPWGDEVCAAAINDAGTVLLNGSPLVGTGRGVQTWLWQGDKFSLLQNLGSDTWGVSLTAGGRVAGHALTPAGERHAVFWNEGRCYDINPGGGCESEALAANDDCVVVGRLLDARGVSQAFRWTPGDGMRPLGDFVAYAEGWTLQKASCLNARGQIAGVGIYEGRRRGFLLTPEA